MGPCFFYQKAAIKQIEAKRLSNVGPAKELEKKEADLSRLGQLKAPLGVYEEKQRQMNAQWNVYRSMEWRNNYCAVLKAEIGKLQGEEDATKRAELQRLLESAEEKGKEEAAIWLGNTQWVSWQPPRRQFN